MEQDIQKYLDNARRAMQIGDWERVEKYYTLVEENEPENIEAIFYASYARLRESLVLNDLYKRRTSFDLFAKSIVIVWKIVERKNSLLELVLVKKMGEDVLNLVSCAPAPVYRQVVRQRNAYRILVGQEEIGFSEFLSMQRKIVDIFGSFIAWCVQKHPSSSEILGACLQTFKEREAASKKADELSESGGCYVATCVYGSYDCPEVWTLRRYRDEKLGTTWYGRVFIRIYYAVSPKLVKWFGHTAWFKRFWRGKLDRMVASLQAKGVANTPYQDKEW